MSKYIVYLNVLSVAMFIIILLLIFIGCGVNRTVETFQNDKEHFKNEMIELAKSNGHINIDQIEQSIRDKKLTKDDLDSISKALEEHKPVS